MPLSNLIGLRFSRLLVESRGPNTKHGTARWHCKCDCGESRLISARSLVAGKTRSCGCLQAESRMLGSSKGWFKPTHGQCGYPKKGRAPALEYTSWAAMKNRCNNPNAADYGLYGGRGIQVCDRWNSSFEDFAADMGPRPSRRHTIERIENDLGYFPGNCYWATPLEQANNRRGNLTFEVGGVTLTVAQLAKRAGLQPTVVYWRLRRGNSIQEALRPTKSAIAETNTQARS